MNRAKRSLGAIVLSIMMIITMIPTANAGAMTTTEQKIMIEPVEGYERSVTNAGGEHLGTSGTTWVKNDGTEAFFYHEGQTYHVTNPEIPLAKDFGKISAYAMLDDMIDGKNVLAMYDEAENNVLLDGDGKLIKNASEYRKYQHLVDDMSGTEYDDYVSYEVTTENSADIYVCDENGKQVLKLSIDNSKYWGDVYVRHFAGVFLFVDYNSYLLAACDINGTSYSAKGSFYGDDIRVNGGNGVLYVDNYYTAEWVDGELKQITKEEYEAANPIKTYKDPGVEVEAVDGLTKLVKYEVNGTCVYVGEEEAIVNGYEQTCSYLLDKDLELLEQLDYGIFIHENYILVNNPWSTDYSAVYKVTNLPAGKVTLDTIELEIGEVLALSNENLDKLISNDVVAENNGLQKLYFGKNVTIDSQYVSQTLFYEMLDANTYEKVKSGYWTLEESAAFAKEYMDPETYECTYNGQKVIVVEEGEGVADYNIRADKAGTTNLTIPEYKIGDSTVELIIPIKITEKQQEAPNTPPAEEKPVVKLDETKIEETKNEIKEAIKKTEESNATKPVQVVVDMKKQDGTVATEVPKDILEVAKGKNVDVVLDMGAYKWTINGNNINGTELKDINLEVTLNTKNIPESTVEALAEGKETRQLSLTHNGDFGFKAELTVNLDKKNEGKYGNLYYYNKDNKLEFMNAGKIDKDGNVGLDFNHASEYVVIISDAPMGNNKDTGDNANIAFYTSLLLAGAGLLFISLRKRQTV